MKIIHIYDGHERVFPGQGSSPYIVYNIAKYTAAKGHDVTILERRWKGLDYREEIEGIKFGRFDVHFCSSVSRKELPQELITSPTGLLRFILDRAEFAVKALLYLKKSDFDVILVHLPIAVLSSSLNLIGQDIYNNFDSGIRLLTKNLLFGDDKLISKFIDSIDRNTKPPVLPEDGKKVVEIAEYIVNQLNLEANIERDDKFYSLRI